MTFENSPGKSFAQLLAADREGEWREAVFFEQEETRAIRTHRYACWKRLPGTGSHALFDLMKDPRQLHNLYGDPAYREIAGQLDTRLVDFFAQYSNAEYDLWKGGTVKGSIPRPWVYRQRYGEEWRPTAEVKPSFNEQ